MSLGELPMEFVHEIYDNCWQKLLTERGKLNDAKREKNFAQEKVSLERLQMLKKVEAAVLAEIIGRGKN